MIKNSFIFLDRIGKITERRLWKEGIKSWNDFLERDSIYGIGKKSKYYYDRKLKGAKKALYNNNGEYFNHLGVESWRLYNLFKEEVLFLDIEINSKGKIIVLGMFDGWETKIMVKGVNLEKKIFEEELDKYKLLITFNGKSFDVPKIEKEFNIKINLPHIDLKHLCNRLGLKGGLKKVEEMLNIKRPRHLKGSCVNLWKAFHASGDKEWLELLIRYNEEDIINLKKIMEYCYEKLSGKIKKLL